MTDYYDGPRAGLADYRGRPHVYSSPFAHWEAGLEDLYELRAADDETVALAREDWEIWLRWETAYYAGETSPATHPALPLDQARHEVIAPILAARLAALPGPVVRVRGRFRPVPGHTDAGRGRWMEVHWTEDRD